MNRRHLLNGVIGAAGALVSGGRAVAAADSDSRSVRGEWIALAERIARPVLENLAAGTLRKNMPVEQIGAAGREKYSHLEAFGRLIAGIAPWLECDRPEPWTRLAQAGMAKATDPASPDYMNFSSGGQPLVDAAFLAQGILRAPKVLWEELDEGVKGHVKAALLATRAITPGENNWLLFAATVEAALFRMGVEIKRERVGHALTKHEEWYKGDGVYGDGPAFHMDYYNSFVIQPMLVDVLEVFREDSEWSGMREKVLKRAVRYAEIQERMISPEGAYPVVGRSMVYRFGAFHALAQIALLEKLEGVTPAGVRSALTTVFRRQEKAEGTYDQAGWLTLGFCGHQPALAESYVSTGSTYLCACALLPLGLPESAAFWKDPDAPWTQVEAWSGVNLKRDSALK